MNPLVKIKNRVNIRSSSTKRSRRGDRCSLEAQRQVSKNIDMLQAYGEFDRFMKMSK